jgi:hypothetical protein
LSSDLRFYDKSDPGIDQRWYRIWTPGDGLWNHISRFSEKLISSSIVA